MTTATPTKTVTKQSGPSDRELKRAVIAFALTTAVDAFVKLPTKTVAGVKLVTLPDGTTLPRETALYAVKQTFGYIPSDIWDARLGARDVGRPVATPATKTATATAPTKTATAPTKTATAPTKTAAVKTPATKTATPATKTKTAATKTKTAATATATAPKTDAPATAA